jgi:hypothetical protein
MTNPEKNEAQEASAQILLFFLLIFLVGSSIYYSFSDNVGFRSFLYLLTSAVSAASYWGSRPAMKKLALVLDRQTNTCRFPSGPLEGLSYPITEKPLDTLLRARVDRKKAVVKSSGPYGAPIRVSTTLRKITLEFSDGQMIGWEDWGNLPNFHLKHLTNKINRFISNPKKNQLVLFFYVYNNYMLFLIFVCISCLLLAIFYR